MRILWILQVRGAFTKYLDGANGSCYHNPTTTYAPDYDWETNKQLHNKPIDKDQYLEYNKRYLFYSLDDLDAPYQEHIQRVGDFTLNNDFDPIFTDI